MKGKQIPLTPFWGQPIPHFEVLTPFCGSPSSVLGRPLLFLKKGTYFLWGLREALFVKQICLVLDIVRMTLEPSPNPFLDISDHLLYNYTKINTFFFIRARLNGVFDLMWEAIKKNIE